MNKVFYSLFEKNYYYYYYYYHYYYYYYYRKDLQISHTFFPKICDQNRRCGPFGKGAVNFCEWTLLWHNTGINATLQQQESIGHCFCEFGGS